MFDDLAKIESGKILASTESKFGVKGIIVRGPCSLCAYIGIPKWHPLAQRDYNDIPLSVHGGLTFGKDGDGERWDKDLFWYGWDYAHAGDVSFYELEREWATFGEHGWTLYEVSDELEQALKDFMWLYFVGWIPFLLKQLIRRLADG